MRKSGYDPDWYDNDPGSENFKRKIRERHREVEKNPMCGKIVKVIAVDRCVACPHCKHESGMGHCESFWICTMYKILFDKPYFNIYEKIHPDCKLVDIQTLTNPG
jgi:hypothetical protein